MEEVKGQEIPKKILSSMIKKGDFPPALLFYGPRGVGKFSLALSFCQEILKDEKRIEKGVHPDLLVVFPEYEGYQQSELMEMRRNKNYFLVSQKKGSVSIDTIRKVQEYVYITPMENPWRIVIIAEADRITEEGFNAFLKVLEEPPPFVIFILITQDKNALPQTIISRCKLIRFEPLSIQFQKEILKGMDIKRFGRGIEETMFLNSQEKLGKEIEEIFFNLHPKSRIRNWREDIVEKFGLEFLLPYLQKQVEDRYKRKEITYDKAWEIFSYIKNAYKYYYSNISPEKIIFYLMLKV
ncbi:MAG: AAA family ATPase [candidate division WOR-3 bacterium]